VRRVDPLTRDFRPQRLDDLIVTGPTGTNVMDLMAILVAGETE